MFSPLLAAFDNLRLSPETPPDILVKLPDVEPTPADITRAKNAVLEASNTPEAVKALCEDIQSATNAVATTLEDFKQVHAKLLVIDTHEIITGEKLAPQWKRLYDKYYNILSLAKTHANEIAAFGMVFEQSILKLVNPDHLPKSGAETRIKLIQNSLEVTEKFQNDAKALEKEIDDLSCGLADMAILMNPDNFCKDPKGEKVEKEIMEVRSKIEKLKKIHSLDAQITSLANMLHIPEIGEGIANAFIPLYGLVLLRAAAATLDGTPSAAQSDSGKKIREGWVKEAAALEARLPGMQKKLSQIRQTRLELMDAQGKIINIRGALAFFAKVWAGIKSICDKLITFLGNSTFTKADMMEDPDIFAFQVDLPQTHYSALNKVLTEFATGLARFDKPSDSGNG